MMVLGTVGVGALRQKRAPFLSDGELLAINLSPPPMGQTTAAPGQSVETKRAKGNA